jgi:hypothetical protein
MPVNGKKSLTLYEETVETLGNEKAYGETWDEYLLSLLLHSGRLMHTEKNIMRAVKEGDKDV